MTLLLSFSIPLFIGNIFQQLYSMVDTIVVGRFVGVDALAAVGSTSGFSFMVVGFAQGLTAGFAVIVSQRYGAKDDEAMRKAYAMSKRTVELEPHNSTYLDTFGWILYLQGRAVEAKPFFKNAVMLYGGKKSPVILDHYAEVLFALKEYDLAFLYWNQAKAINNGEIEDLDSRISLRKSQMKKDER